MTEAWQQAAPAVVHTLPQGAENALGCTVYGVVLQPDASTLQQAQSQLGVQPQSQLGVQPQQQMQVSFQSRADHLCVISTTSF